MREILRARIACDFLITTMAQIPNASLVRFLRLVVTIAIGGVSIVGARGAAGSPSSEQGDAQAAANAGGPRPLPQQRVTPPGDLFDQLTKVLEDGHYQSILSGLNMPAATAAKLVPIVTDELRHPEIFLPDQYRLGGARTGIRSSDMRRPLLEFLWELGPLAAGSGATLAALINSKVVSPSMQIKAASTSVRVTGQSEPGISFLVELMRQGDLEAIDELGMLGTQASTAAKDLADLVNSKGKSTHLRAHAASSLVRITGRSEPGIPFLLQLLKEPGPNSTLPESAPSASEDPANEDRLTGLQMLVELGPLAKEAEATMIVLANSIHLAPSFRISTAAALVTIEEGAGAGLTTLCTLLNDPGTDSQNISEILRALERLGPLAASAAPVVIGLVEARYDDASLKREAAATLTAMLTAPILAKLPPADYLDEASQLILAVNGDEGPFVQLQLARLEAQPDGLAKALVAENLARLGSKARLGVLSLQRLMVDHSPGAQIAGASALIRITGNPEPGVTTLIGALHASENGVVYSAIDALGEVGSKAASAVAALNQLIDNEKSDPLIRACAAHAVVRITDQARPGISTLSNLLTNGDASVEAGAMEMLADLGPKAKGAIPALTERLNSETTDPRTQLRAASALIAIDESPLAAVPQLIKILTNTELDKLKRQLADAQAEVAGLRRWLDAMQNATAEEYLRSLKQFGLSDPKIAGYQSELLDVQGRIAAMHSQGAAESDPRLQALSLNQANAEIALKDAVDSSKKNFELRYRRDKIGTAFLGEAVELSAKDNSIQVDAAKQLRDLGPKAADAIPALNAILSKSADASELKIYAASALAQIAGKPGIDALSEMLYSTSPNLKRLVVCELGVFMGLDGSWLDSMKELEGFVGRPALTDGRLMASVETALFRSTATTEEAKSEQLTRMLIRHRLFPRPAPQLHDALFGPKDGEQIRMGAITTLVGLLHTKGNDDTVIAAAQALGNLGVYAARAAPSLIEILKTDTLNPQVKISAALALIRITGVTYPCGRVLPEGLQGPLRMEFIAQLGDLEVPEAMPILLAMRDTITDLRTLRAIDVSLSKLRNTVGI